MLAVLKYCADLDCNALQWIDPKYDLPMSKEIVVYIAVFFVFLVQICREISEKYANFEILFEL